MKKIITLACALFIFQGIIAAQSDDASSSSFFSKLKYGAKAGFNFSNMYGDVGNNAFSPFFHLGMVADFPIIDKLVIGAEPHISIEGQRLNGGYDRITYLNISVLAKYSVLEKLSVDGGLKMGIKIIEKTKFSNGNTNRRNRFKTLAPGVVIGATYAFNQNWFAQFRYNIKFSDVVRKGGGDSEGSIIMLFQFSAGYFFGG